MASLRDVKCLKFWDNTHVFDFQLDHRMPAVLLNIQALGF